MIQKDFGHTIKYYREKLGLSQEKFALSISSIIELTREDITETSPFRMRRC